MSLIKRFKQIALLVGSVAILGGLALVGVVAYLWWDSRGATEEFDTGSDVGSGTDIDSEKTDIEFDTDEETTGE